MKIYYSLGNIFQIFNQIQEEINKEEISQNKKHEKNEGKGKYNKTECC